MEDLKFKTNLKCEGCVKAITPNMDKVAGAGNWQADLSSADKIVTVKSTDADAGAVQQAIKDAGYTAEQV